MITLKLSVTGAPPLSSLWVSDSNAFRKLGCTHSQFSEVLGYIHDPEKPGVLNEFFRVFFTILPDKCRDFNIMQG